MREMERLTESRRLLRTPRPYPEESLKGLIVRATEENGYDMSSVLSSLADVVEDFKTKRTMYTEQRWRNLSEMLNIDIPTLKDLACLSGIGETPPKAYNMYGHRIHKYSVRVGAPKVCPGCLRDKEYIRKIWDLAAFTCCPQHGTLLIGKCPNCGKAIGWNRGKVSVCPCGQDWRDIVLPKAAEAEKTLSCLILQVCGLWKAEEPSTDAAGEGATGQEGARPNPLSTASLGELLSAVYFIAGQQHGVVDATGKQYAVKLPQEDLHKALTGAIAIFEDWPKRFHKFLDECRGKISTRSGQSGLYKDFGKMYDPLFVRKGNPLPDFMREAFKRYITTYWDGGYAGWCSAISEDELFGKTFMTKHETARHLRISHQTVNLLHKKGYLRGRYYPWVNRSRIMIEAESVRELKGRWDKSITAVQAGDILGIGRIAVVSLVNSGCLAAIQGPAVTGQLEWKFEVCEVRKLLDQAAKKIAVKKGGARLGRVDFHKAIQKLSNLSIEVGPFVKLILDGTILPAARSKKTGLSALLFDEKDIEEFSRAKAKERRGSKHTIQEVSKMICAGHDVIRLLIKQGLIAAEQVVRHNEVYFLIEHEEIVGFNNTYSTTHQMARIAGTSARHLSHMLMANGIMPVSGPKVDRGNYYYFRKADIEAVDLSAILSKTKIGPTQRMNDKGLFSKGQVADITGYTSKEIGRIVKTRRIIPAATERFKDGKGSATFFSHDQVEKFKELKAEEARQLIMFDAKPNGIRSAA